MVNQHRGDFELDLGDTKVSLRGDYGAIARYENEYDSIYELLDDLIIQRMSFSKIVTLIWCSQREISNQYTKDEIGNMVQELGLFHIIPIIQQFLEIMFDINTPRENVMAEDEEKKSSPKVSNSTKSNK